MGKVKEKDSTAVGTGRRVGLVYDERMCKHDTPDGEPHPENPNRIRAIWNHLLLHQIPKWCVVICAKEVEDKYLLGVHSKNHVKLIKSISTKVFDARRNRTAPKFDSIYFNKGSKESAYLAAGSVVEVAERVAKGELNSAAAIVRPPGHHAECEEPMGFCLFNNVAVAASFLLDGKPQLGIKKILIVDWDVHHGNGTQQMFWEDSRILVFSVHRHDFGNFYPANDDGFYTMIGEGKGAGYNINVPWENGRCGDADYLAVWDHILIPVAKEFDPDMIIVSAGFDAAIGDPLGGCLVTPHGYSVMLKKLMDFAQGRIVLALEGGYNLDSTAKSFLACIEVLLNGKLASGSLEAYPFESTWRVIQAVRKRLSTHWSTLADELPLKLTSQKVPSLPSSPEASLSHVSHDFDIKMADVVPSPAVGRIPQLSSHPFLPTAPDLSEGVAEIEENAPAVLRAPTRARDVLPHAVASSLARTGEHAAPVKELVNASASPSAPDRGHPHPSKPRWEDMSSSKLYEEYGKIQMRIDYLKKYKLEIIKLIDARKKGRGKRPLHGESRKG